MVDITWDSCRFCGFIINNRTTVFVCFGNIYLMVFD
uniref:Uncharacterized protein n=1 Tax=Rhizophora mucronata TaxID=61149 RepID=A0A2P2QZC9_RHIMU